MTKDNISMEIFVCLLIRIRTSIFISRRSEDFIMGSGRVFINSICRCDWEGCAQYYNPLLESLYHL